MREEDSWGTGEMVKARVVAKNVERIASFIFTFNEDWSCV